MSEELKDKIDDLSREMKDRKLAEKVYQAENHAAQLNASAAVLDGYVICCWKCRYNLTLAQKFWLTKMVDSRFQILISVIMNVRATWPFCGRA